MTANAFSPLRLGILCGGLVLSCGGSKPEAADPSSAEGETSTDSAAVESSGDAAGGAETKLAWADMDREQRLEFMGVEVMPKMKTMFQEFDAESYAEFKCQTCHGEDMEQVDYKMPNGLFALPKDDPVAAGKDYDEKVTDFMLKVSPAMKELLGTQVTCNTCHDVEE